MGPATSSLEPYALSLMRIILSITFCCHGFQKLFGLLGGLGGSGAIAAPGSLFWFAGLIETFGGLLLLVGLLTRPVAFILCGEMAVAYFSQHFHNGFWPIKNGGELAVIYCFVFLYLIAAGPGPWSLDRLIWNRQGAPAGSR